MKLKTLLIIGAMLIASASLKAGHFIGGDIYYEFVGNNSTDNRYAVNVALYQNSGGIPLPSSLTIHISSSCYSGSTASLPLDAAFVGGVTVNSFNSCVSSTTTSINKWLYSDTVTLAGTCGDWRFSYFSVSRSNTKGSEFTDDFYLHATLNNFYEQNTSPQFLNPIELVCANSYYSKPISNGIEPDNDSIRYKIAIPLSDSVKATVWDLGYGPINPIATLSSNPFILDPHSGLLSFTSVLAEISIYAYEIEEYKMDPINGIWYLAGTIKRDLEIIIENCDSSVSIAGQAFPPGNSVSSVFYEIDFKCNSDSLLIDFRDSVKCSSIDPLGSDFQVYSVGIANNIPISSIEILNCKNGLTKQVVIWFPLNLRFNSDYLISTQTGVDANSLLSKCGFEYGLDTMLARFPPGTFVPMQFTSDKFFGTDPQVDFICADTIVRIEVDRDVLCGSVASDGSDFDLINASNNQQLTIKSATPINCFRGNSKTIELILDGALSIQGHYYLSAKVGSDGNTFRSDCGLNMMPGEKVVLVVDTTCSGVGISETEKKTIKIYPNPTNDYVNITGLESETSVVVMDVLGNELRHLVTTEENVRISLSNLPKGLYFLQIKQANKVLAVEKIIKE